MISTKVTNGCFSPDSIICWVEYTPLAENQESKSGIGAIYESKIPEGQLNTFFITSYQVLSINDPKEVVGLKLSFRDERLQTINLTPDWVKTVWSNKEFGVTAIELSKIAIDRLSYDSQLNLDRIFSAAPLEKEDVLVFNYRNGKLYTGNSSINAINGTFIEYNFVDSELNIIGSPLLNKHFQAVGITICSLNPENKNKQKAIIMSVIFNAIKQALNAKIEKIKQMDSNLWLDFLSSLPKQPKETLQLQLIGTGGNGKVFKTIEPNGNVIALKLVVGFGSLEGYKKEAKALDHEFKLISHIETNPRIIQYFGFVRDDDNAKLIIIMEYIDGGSLSEKLDLLGKLDISNCLRYLVQILEGVKFLHNLKIYHSDLKPDNILITANGDIKICDFGLALQERNECSAPSSNTKEGTVYYMSPERINGNPRNAANDVWSIGAIFVKMITGNTINSNDKSLLLCLRISIYEIVIENRSLSEYLFYLKENDYKKQIIKPTLCSERERCNSSKLLDICMNLQSEAHNLNEYAICSSTVYYVYTLQSSLNLNS